ncbi:MAG: GAF and ANTAR domain-containing protein [Nocardioides sp.]
MISADRLAGVFVEVADTLVADFDLIEFLHNLADHAADLSGASAAGLLLADQNDQLHYMAASSEGARHLELFQLQHSEGPCLDCHRTGEPIIVTDLRDATGRWPDFAPRAVAAGVHSVHAFPMRLRDKVIGALNVFGEGPLPLNDGDVRLVQSLADIATISIIQERAIAHAEMLTEQLQGALNTRIVIEQAKGVISRTHRIGVDAAFDLLRAHARRNHLRLGDLAHDIVTGDADVPGPGAVAGTER